MLANVSLLLAFASALSSAGPLKAAGGSVADEAAGLSVLKRSVAGAGNLCVTPTGQIVACNAAGVVAGGGGQDDDSDDEQDGAGNESDDDDDKPGNGRGLGLGRGNGGLGNGLGLGLGLGRGNGNGLGLGRGNGNGRGAGRGNQRGNGRGNGRGRGGKNGNGAECPPVRTVTITETVGLEDPEVTETAPVETDPVEATETLATEDPILTETALPDVPEPIFTTLVPSNPEVTEAPAVDDGEADEGEADDGEADDGEAGEGEAGEGEAGEGEADDADDAAGAIPTANPTEPVPVSRAGGTLNPTAAAEAHQFDETATRAFEGVQIRSPGGQCLSIDPTAGDFRQNLIPVALVECSGSPNEKFDVVTAGKHNNVDGAALLVSSLTNGCISFDGRREAGDTVILFSCGGRAAGEGETNTGQLIPFDGATDLVLAPVSENGQICFVDGEGRVDSAACAGDESQVFTIVE